MPLNLTHLAVSGARRKYEIEERRMHGRLWWSEPVTAGPIAIEFPVL